jgi:hypothetical protein
MKRLFTFLILALALTSLQAQFVDFQIGIWKGVISAGDIDNDGDLDLILSGQTDATSVENGAVLINDGAGNFTAQTGARVITAGRGGNIHFGDIDGDGDLDVIFAGWETTNNAVKAGIALNDGNGVFTLATTYPVLTANKITSAGFADFDLNGLLDYYFFANDAGNCVIYFQQPDGSFTANAEAIQTTQRFGESIGSPIAYKFNEAEATVVDFDSDGYPDVWINAADLNATNTGEQTQRFSYLFRNNGFGILNQFSGVNVPYKKANGTSSWGDINGDGYPDLLLNGDGHLNSGEPSDSTWRFFENAEGKSITERYVQPIARQQSVGNGSVIVDWDNDGKLDFFSGGWNNLRKVQETALFLGDDPSQFTFTRSSLSDSYFQGASEQGLLAADLNGDNKVELLISGFCASPLSRRASGYMPNQSATASVPPAAPTNLAATFEEYDSDLEITFSWNAPTSEAGKYGTTYNLALKNTTTGKWLYNPMAVIGGEKNGWRKVGGRMGNVFHNTLYRLYNLPDGNYEWTVQAINGAYLGGAFAQTQTFKIGNVGFKPVDTYKPEVYTLGKKLVVNGKTSGPQSLKVYSASGALLASIPFTGSTEVELQTGVYILELTTPTATPYRTKALIGK